MYVLLQPAMKYEANLLVSGWKKKAYCEVGLGFVPGFSLIYGLG